MSQENVEIGRDLEIAARYASIWTFTNGRVMRVKLGLDPDEALWAVGLPEQATPVSVDRRPQGAPGRPPVPPFVRTGL